MKKALTYYVNVDWFFISHRFDLALEAKRREFDVTVLTPITDEKYFTALSKEFKVVRLKNDRGLRPFRSLSNVGVVLLHILRTRPDVLHVISLKPILISSVLSIFFRGPKYVFAFSGLGPVFNPRTIMQKLLTKIVWRVLWVNIKLNNVAIVQNEVDKSVVSQLFSIDRILLVPGSGINCQDRFYFRHEDNIVVSFAGRFVVEKGLLLFLEAINTINRDHCDLVKRCGLEFHIAGWADANSRNPIDKSVIKDLSNIDNVKFFGRLDSLDHFLKKTDIFVFPSTYPEGLPKVLCEAFSHSCSVISTRFVGSADYLNGENAFLISATANELIRAIVEMVGDPVRRRSVAENGYQTAKRIFDKNVINVTQMSYIEERLLNEKAYID